MDKDKLLSLAERCEAATGPDRELDRCLFAVKRDVEREDVTGPIGFSPTASLDAAMTLVPEGSPLRQRWKVETTAEGAMAQAWRYKDEGGLAYSVCSNGGKTPALALCAAALRSHAQKEEG